MRRSLLIVTLCTVLMAATSAAASPADALRSVVSVLPVWPNQPQGGAGARPGTAPEGSGVVLRPSLIATAWHVIEPAERIDVRLAGGRILPAELVGHDAASDIALLSVNTDLVAFEIAPEPDLTDRACAIGNAFGLGLSITCGVVSAKAVTNAGFNAVEDFVQTDAATNPGVSGGALVDGEGRLVGMMSAIFASDADANIGINFAVSTELLLRVAEALVVDGEVAYPAPGWRLRLPQGAERETLAAPVIAELARGGPAQSAGFESGDVVITVGTRRTQSPRDVIAALAVQPRAASAVEVELLRGGERLSLSLPLVPRTQPQGTAASPQTGQTAQPDCPHPAPVCARRRVVFPVSGFDPIGSATRVGPDLLITNRHMVGELTSVFVLTPEGEREAKVLPSDYLGDLTILQVVGLPEASEVPSLTGAKKLPERYYAIGADVARQEVRVFEPGDLIAPPAETSDLGRLHVSARMQPGVSGGALVDETGTLVGIAVGGGDGRFEAIPVADVVALLKGQSSPSAVTITRDLGVSFTDCALRLEGIPPRSREISDRDELVESCAAAMNHGQLLEAGRVLSQAGDFEGAIRLHGLAAEQVPNSINARVSLLVSLQLAGRFEEMTVHAGHVMRLDPDDPQILRFGIQSGVWGGAPALAEEAYTLLLNADPRQAEAARRFIDNAPPAPIRR
ncbi:MAG: trypsin-like peptidase domain-containing protein [Pseudomonadota bacterium]